MSINQVLISVSNWSTEPVIVQCVKFSWYIASCAGDLHIIHDIVFTEGSLTKVTMLSVTLLVHCRYV